MHVLPKLSIPQIEHELKDILMFSDSSKSLVCNFLYTHLTIKVNIILIIILKNTKEIKSE